MSTADEPVAPIARARVILTAEALSEPRVAIAAADGTFTFENLPAGSYAVAASASGYASEPSPRRRTEAAPVTVADGQAVTGLNVLLPRAGYIEGRVLDEDERPFAGAIIEALARRTVEGRATLIAMSSARTDDRGGFRLHGLAAGHYLVSALDPAFETVGDHTGALRYVPTYYPGVVDVADALTIGVVPGLEPDVQAEFRLRIVRPAIVAGRIIEPDGRQLLSGAIIMVPESGEGLESVPDLLPDGTFVFTNVPPGEYQLRARAEVEAAGVSLFATYRLDVNGRDIRNVALTLAPGASVKGTVTFEALERAAPSTFGRMRVRAPFADGRSFGDAPTGDVGADGAYWIRGMMAGTHFVTVENLEFPWVLKSVVWRGRNITDTAIDVVPRETLDDVRITITDGANDVSGTVKDQRGRPVADALVLAIPVSPQFWTRTSRRFGILYTSADGNFRVRGLPAGEYRVIATTHVDESQVFRKDVLTRLLAAGLPLILGERQTPVLDLALTPLTLPSAPRTR